MPRHLLLPLALLVACSDYGFNRAKDVDTAGGPGQDSEPPVDTGPALPDILVGPPSHDFGTLDPDASAELDLTVSNVGNAPLVVDSVSYDTSSGELSLDRLSGENGSLPWVLDPGGVARLRVSYLPTDSTEDSGTVLVGSNDPDEAQAQATQVGNGRGFDGFSTGWYVYDDGIAYETTSSSDHVIDHHGDEDLYWYEPSGAHGLIDSPDPEADFAVMRQYVLDHAGSPVEATGPFSYDASSSLATYEWATFTYFMCDFYLDASDDPSRYEISSGVVDDGIQVMVNGEILGRLELGNSGSWPLDNAHPGEVNTLIVILVDDSEVNKYVHDLAFYRDGKMVTG